MRERKRDREKKERKREKKEKGTQREREKTESERDFTVGRWNCLISVYRKNCAKII